jgi:hypothetical protein
MEVLQGRSRKKPVHVPKTRKFLIGYLATSKTYAGTLQAFSKEFLGQLFTFCNPKSKTTLVLFDNQRTHTNVLQNHLRYK